MTIEPNKQAFIIVEAAWSERRWVRTMLGPPDSGRTITGDHVPIIAKIVDYQDSRGLWIELNTAKSRKDPTVHRHSMLIPWAAVISIVYNPDLSDTDEEELRRLYELSGPADAD